MESLKTLFLILTISVFAGFNAMAQSPGGDPPSLFHVTGSGFYCSDGTGAPVGLDSTEVGVTYTLYKGTVAQTPAVNGTGSAISFGNRLAGTYTVKGTSQIGLGTMTMTGSAVITVKQAQTISFDAITTKTYGAEAFKLTAVAGSSLPVSYVSSNTDVATVSHDTITIIGAGTADITASQAGDASYCSATDVIQTLTVSKKSITITGVTASNKVYDGNTVATLSGGSLEGVVSGDEVTIAAGTGAFSDKNVGTGKTVTATGYSLEGAQAGNYSLSAQPTVSAADITAKPISLSGVTASNKVYDGNTVATLSGGSLDGVVSGDEVTIAAGAGAFSDKNVGAGKTVTATGYSLEGAQAGNYTLSAQPSGITADITGMPLTITGVTASNKVYDGNTTATLSGGALEGVVNSDNVILVAGTGSFADANVGTGKTVTATGYSIVGSQVGNYSLSAQPTVGTADITTTSLTITGVTAANKVYDGNTVATLSGGSLSGVVSGDEVTIVTGTGAFADANAGSGKTVTATGYSLEGAQVGNYTLSAQPIVGVANITAKSVDISGVTAANKAYDGTTTATLSGGSLNGVVNSDDVTIVAGTGAFADANIGTGKTVTTTGYSLDGTKVGNYTLSGQPSGITADITGIPLTITGVTAANKVYDGDSIAALSGGSLDGVVSGDEVTIVVGTGAFADANIGTGKTVTAAGYSLEGAQAGNYSLSAQPTVGTADITAKPVSISGVTAANKSYDGTTTATLSGGSLNGVVNSDDVTIVAGSGVFADANVGTGIIVTASGYSLDGSKAGNYTLSAQPDGLTADITAVALTITAEDKTKVYDGSVYSPFTVTYSGFISGEDQTKLTGTLSFGGSASTAITAGTGYIIKPYGLTSANYAITYVDGKLDITPKAQSITFDALAAKKYGDADFNLSGTASSSLSLSYASSNPLVATISGNTVTIVGAGNTTITASQGGDDNYSAATDATQVLTVDKADQVLTLDPLPVGSIALKDFVGAIPVTASSSAGLSVTISLGSGSAATLNGSNELINIGQTGNVIINVDQAGNANYNPASISYTFDVTKSNQVITFDAMSSQVYSDGLTVDLTGKATTTSPLAISYSVVSGPATISGDILTITGAGIIVVEASQAGDAAWNAATSEAQSLEITKATAVIGDFGDLTKNFSDADFTLNATSVSTGLFTYSSSDTSVATVSGNTVHIVGAGTAVLTAVQGFDDNYAQATKTANLIVGATNQTITFGALTEQTYGDAAFTLTAAASSDLTVSYTSSNSAVATVSGNTVTIVGVGSTDITASQAGNANYNAASDVIQVLTVVKKSLAISGVTASNKSYDGTTTATLSGGSLNGVVNSDDVTIVAGSGVFADANVGTGIIVTASGYSLDGSKAGNYTLSAQPDGLTADITKANQTITFGALAAKTYGDTPFTVSATGGASGSPVTFTSSDDNIVTCTGSNGSTITIVNYGSCTIYANQAGSNNYNSATQVGQLLTVNNASFAVTFATPSNGMVTVKNGSLPLASGDLVFNGTTLTVTTTPDLGYAQNSLTANAVAVVGNSVTVAGITNIAATFTIPVWTGSTDTDWNTDTNWTPGVVPTTLIDAIVPAVSNMPLAADNSACHNLTISLGAVVTIPAAKSLTVAGSITNNAGVAGLVVKSSTTLANGTLIFNNGQDAPVQSTVEMYSKASWNLANTSGDKYKWQFFGVPVRSVITSPTFKNAYVRRYDESQSTFNWVAETSTSSLVPFKGYEITQQAAKTYTLTGELVNADFSETLVKTNGALNAGNHVFANPYTAAIDITKLNFGTQTEASVYLFNTGSVADWTTYVGTTTGANPGQYTAAPASTAGVGGIPGQVPSMQGFVVKAMSNDVNATFGIPYSSLVTKNVDAQRAPSANRSNSTGGFVYTIIDVAGAQGGDRMWLFTDESCTHNFDNSWDGRKMFGSALVPQLFAKETDGDYQVNSVNDVNNTNLGFQAGTDSVYKLRFTHANVQSVYDKLYLYDYITGGITDITESGTEYSFVAQSTSTPASRFRILSTLAATTGEKSITDNSAIKVFSSNKTIFVRNMSKEDGDLILYDVAGRFINRLPFNPMSITAIPMKLVPGVYVVTAVINNEKVVTSRVIIP